MTTSMDEFTKDMQSVPVNQQESEDIETEQSYYFDRLIEFMASQAKQNEFETYKS